MKGILVSIALFMGAWLLFDGARALIVGDYVTPRSGPSAGQLGAWSRLVAAAGFSPRSTVIKLMHLLLGLGWLGAVRCWLLRPALGWWALFSVSFATLWYLPVGTVLALAELGLLFMLRRSP